MGNLFINTGGISTNKEGMASIDLRYGPYVSLSAAHAALSADGLCAIGLTVGIINDNKIDEYWYQEGIELSNLVKKIEVDSVPTEDSPNAVSSGGVYDVTHGTLKTRYIPFDLRGEAIIVLSNEDMTELFGPATMVGGQSIFDLTVGQYQHIYRVTNSKSEVFEIPAAYHNANGARKIVGINGNLTIELSFTITNGVYVNAAIAKRETSIPGISYEEEQDLTDAQRRTAQQNIGLEKDVAGGVAGLNESGKIEATQMPTTVVQTENGKVPASVLPAYVDDVIEGYYGSPTVPDFNPSLSYSAGDTVGYNGKIYCFTETHAAGDWNPDDVEEVNPFPVTGETGKVYSDIIANTTYRWSGSTYTQIKGDLSLGETSETAFAGNRGKALEQQMPLKQDTIQDLSTIRNNALYGPTSVQFGAAQQLTPTQQVNAQNNMMGKAYAPAQFSGLGKKILTKNIQQVGGVSKNVMTQAFFEDEQGNALTNTVFVIQYDYTLGENITIPAGCVLEFDGGSISAGSGENMDTITGANTGIQAGLVKILNTDVTFAGTWNCVEAYPEWFGAKGDGLNDDTVAINKVLNSFYCVKLTDKTYLIGTADENGNGIIVPAYKSLIGITFKNGTSSLIRSGVKAKDGVTFNNLVTIDIGVTLSNLLVSGNGKSDTHACIGTSSTVSRCKFERVDVRGSYYGFDIACYLTSINQCTASYCNVGFYCHGTIVDNVLTVENTSLAFSSCYAVDCEQAGYYLRGIIYSVVNACACDGCQPYGEITNLANAGYPYKLNACKGITFNSCGIERSLKAIEAVNCQSILFNVPEFYFAATQASPLGSDTTIERVIYISYSTMVKIAFPVFVYNPALANRYKNATGLVKINGAAEHSMICFNVEVAHISYLAPWNIGVEGGLTNSNFKYVNYQVQRTAEEVSSMTDIIRKADTYCPNTDVNLQFSTDIVTSYGGKIDTNKNLIIYGNNKILSIALYITLKGNITFKNTRFTIHGSVSTLDRALDIAGGNIIFESCRFEISKEPTSYFFNIINRSSRIKFKECIFTYINNADKTKIINVIPEFEARLITLDGIGTNGKICFPFGKYIDNGLVFTGANDYVHVDNLTRTVENISVLTSLAGNTGFSPSGKNRFYVISESKDYTVVRSFILPHKGPVGSAPTTRLQSCGLNMIGFDYFATDLGTAGVGAKIYYTGDETTPWVYADGTAVS